ncbi:hypothetical protein FRC00_008905 [Tulasnella sp. 408]|nr:hypothetical protein FRC00_008905 [Tulasnella sp. 408]
MILESLGIPYEILEATGRTGGRLFTYQFYNGNRHDYYDVGAMRYPNAPQNPSMERLFRLFHCQQLNPTGGDRLEDKLMEYYFKCDKAFLYYNGARSRIDQPVPPDYFHFEETGVPEQFLEMGAGEVLKTYVLNDFVPLLLEDLRTGGREGWDHLMEYDSYSTRGYMTVNKKLTAEVVDWVETVTYGTGWFDRALAELVLEYIAFSAFLKDLKYTCIDGGSRVLSDFMTRYINNQQPNALQLGKRVTEIYYASPDEVPSLFTPIRVKVEGESQAREYGHVISTLPVPVLRSLRIDNAGLDVNQAYALRQLQYGPSEKIGVKFRTQWWRTGKQVDGDSFDIIGGQSYSDRVVRTVVYPSYGIPGNDPESTVLIASYSWTEDALRLGAFAFFGPGEFSTIYKSLTRAGAGGRLHFAGEALSIRHAWVVGALDSVWRAVKEVLWLSYPWLLDLFEEEWGNNEEWIIPPDLMKKLNIPEAEDRGDGQLPKVKIDLVLLQLLAHKLGSEVDIGALPADPTSA